MASTTEGWDRRHLSAKIFPKLGAMRLLPEHLDEYVERTDRVSYCLRIEMRLSSSEPSPRSPHRIGMEGKKSSAYCPRVSDSDTHAAAVHRSFFNPKKLETDIEERPGE